MTLFDLQHDQLNFLAAAIGSNLANTYDLDQLNILANFLISIGTNLTLIIASEDRLINKNQAQQTTTQASSQPIN